MKMKKSMRMNKPHKPAMSVRSLRKKLSNIKKRALLHEALVPLPVDDMLSSDDQVY